VIPKDTRKILVVVINFILITAPSSGLQAAESNELRALVTPVALHPDPLVAQLLAAATFPDQVAVANYWLQQNKARSGHALMRRQ